MSDSPQTSPNQSAFSSDELHWASLSELCQPLRDGELSALSLTEHMLSRIERHNCDLHCYTQILSEQALARAEALDHARNNGQPCGLLHGIPIAVKDLLSTKGVVTASGTKVMADHIPDFDASVVTRLHEAGAIVLGKVQLTEGAYGAHHPELTAPINPWGKDLWSGVSSSGSGVSVASGLAFGALGSDTGGSIRFPSAANGLVGIKPTYGRVSRFGAFPLAESLDHIGPLARSVEDAALLLQAIAGHDPHDPNSLEIATPNFSAQLQAGLAGKRFGVDWKYVETGVAPEVVATIRDAVSVLRELGAEIVEVELPRDYTTLVRNWVVTCGVECALAHEGLYPQQRALYGPDLTSLIELGHKVGGLQYSGIERVREHFRRELDGLFASIDGFLCPAMPVSIPTVSGMEAALDDSEERAEFINFTAPFNYSGHPTISLPAGLDDQRRPTGFQIVGRWLDEASLVQAGWAYQRAIGLTARPSF